MSAPPPPADPTPVEEPQGRDLVAVVLAIGLATALNFLTLGVLWDAVNHHEGVSENGTQLLGAVFSGIVGVLGSYVGFRAGLAKGSSTTNTTTTTNQAQPADPDVAPE